MGSENILIFAFKVREKQNLYIGTEHLEVFYKNTRMNSAPENSLLLMMICIRNSDDILKRQGINAIRGGEHTSSLPAHVCLPVMSCKCQFSPVYCSCTWVLFAPFSTCLSVCMPLLRSIECSSTRGDDFQSGTSFFLDLMIVAKRNRVMAKYIAPGGVSHLKSTAMYCSEFH
jgi:hypothetical protein